jgi:hypothetical protein
MDASIQSRGCVQAYAILSFWIAAIPAAMTVGSHHVYTQSGNPARISLTIHKNEELKVGLLKHFMKVAGITEAEL